MLYRQMGILLPRDSCQQAQALETFSVNLNELMPGDLIFFESSSHKVNHVGLYLGQREMIHAKARLYEGAPIVQIHHLDRPVWEEKMVAARRVGRNFPHSTEW